MSALMRHFRLRLFLPISFRLLSFHADMSFSSFLSFAAARYSHPAQPHYCAAFAFHVAVYYVTLFIIFSASYEMLMPLPPC